MFVEDGMITQVDLDVIAQPLLCGLRNVDWKLLRALITGDAVEIVNVLSV